MFDYGMSSCKKRCIYCLRNSPGTPRNSPCPRITTSQNTLFLMSCVWVHFPAAFSVPAIYFAAVANSDNKDGHFFVFDITNDAIVADSIFPQACQLLAKRITETARVLVGGDSVSQILHDLCLRRSVKRQKLLPGRFFKCYLPDQVPSPLPLRCMSCFGLHAKTRS